MLLRKNQMAFIRNHHSLGLGLFKALIPFVMVSHCVWISYRDKCRLKSFLLCWANEIRTVACLSVLQWIISERGFLSVCFPSFETGCRRALTHKNAVATEGSVLPLDLVGAPRCLLTVHGRERGKGGCCVRRRWPPARGKKWPALL